MPDVGEVFAKRLNQLMEAHDDRAKDLADYLQVTESAVSKYRRGRIPDSVEILGKIATRYGTTIDYLVGRDIWGDTPINEVKPLLEREVEKLGFTREDVLRILEALAAAQQRRRED